nr:adenosine receptor A3-like [Ciona intestinalis]|eukprot:XP_026694325.1 adenosine receptor A3-like [Ciona intestinalis]
MAEVTATPVVVTNGTYIRPYTDAWVIASTVFISTFFAFGVCANSVTIAVIKTSRHLKSRYYSFLLSMCFSDLTSGFVSILFLYRRTWGFDYFEWPEFFCRLYWGLDLWTSFSTALHILSFAILRLVGVRWPTLFKQISPTHMTIWISSIWVITFLGGFIPHFLFNTVNVIDRFNDPSSARWASCSLSSYWFTTWQQYVQVAYGFYLYLPAVAIIGISIAIAALLKQRKKPGDCYVIKNTIAVSSVSQIIESSPNLHTSRRSLKMTSQLRRQKKDRQAILQLFLIVGSFLFGYIPLTAFHFYTGFTINISNNVINAFDWRFAMVQYLMLRFSECMNPVFYNLASGKMRGETKKFLAKLCRCINADDVITSQRGVASTSGI